MSTETAVTALKASIGDLRQEQAEIDRKLNVLRDLLSVMEGKAPTKRRGRPKGTTVPSKTDSNSESNPEGKKRKKPNWSPEAKKAAAERMKKYWQKRNAEKASEGSKTKKDKTSPKPGAGSRMAAYWAKKQG